MLRKRAVALAISLMFPAVVPALGLGTLKATSALNQPFEGKIEILGATAEDYDTLNIKLADSAQFDRAGLLRGTALLGLKFDVVSNPNGNDYVRVFTREAVREPYLDFLLELNWAKGKMVREYTVLLDPPLYDPNRRQPKAAAPSARPASPPPMTAPRQAAARTAPVAASGSEIGPVQSGDTLWSIARRNLPGDGVSVHQMMVALLRANPQSFPSGNMNLLRVGTILKMPSAEDIAGVTRRNAIDEIGRQTQSWQEYRQGATRTTAPQQARVTQDSAPVEQAPVTQPKTDAHLEIVAATDKAAVAAGAPGSTTDESKVVAQADTTKELKARLDEAEEIIDLLKRQVEVKNDELARLQGQQLGKGAEVSMPATTPEPAATVAETPPAADKAPAPPAAGEDSSAVVTPAPTTAQAEPAKESATEPAPKPEVAKTPEPPKAPPKKAPPTPAAASGGLEDLVPGGLMTLIGAAVSLLALGGLALRKRFGKTAGSSAPVSPTVSAGLAPAVAVDSADEDDESPIAVTEAPRTQVSQPTVDPGFNEHSRTIEATAESLVDPLEEVNVYLAYERFDQAEELVRKAIAEHPEESRYQHRLLEIFYFSNNLPAYETAAREFREMVGEDHPQWQSVVAMWEAMSPQRALFAAGAAAAAVAAPTEFVDLTATDEPPAGDSMESTHVGLFGASTDNQAPPPADADDPMMNGLLDITAGETEESEMLDLTATVEKLEQAGFLEHEEASHVTTSETEMFDISGSDSGIAGALDALEPEDADTQDPSDTVQLLDLSATGDLFKVTDGAKSDAKALGLANTASGGGLATADAEFTSEVDFDIGELGDLNLDATSNPLDLGLDNDADADELDFDIGALGLGAESAPDQADQTIVLGSPIAARSTAADELESTDFSLDLELPEMDAPAGTHADLGADASDVLDLTSDLPEMLDLTTELPGDRGLGFAAGDTADSDLDLDALNFGASDEGVDLDLSLDETRELNDIYVDANPAQGVPANDTADASMRDLTAELEASLAAFGSDEAAAGEDDFILDLTAAGGQETLNAGSMDVDFTLDGSLTQDMSLAETVVREDFDPAEDLPANAEGGDEVDTKLNLAKAYIELGENDAARSILLEAAREGTDKQQEEAGRLLAQVT